MDLHGSVIHEELVELAKKDMVDFLAEALFLERAFMIHEGSPAVFSSSRLVSWSPHVPHCPFLGNVGAEIFKNKNKNKNSKSPQNQKKVCRQKRKKINRRERKEQTEESHCRTAGACASLRESLARSLTLLCHKGKRRSRGGGKTHFFIAKALSQD